MQPCGEKIGAAENELTGEAYADRILLHGFFGKLDELRPGICAKSHAGLRGQTVAVTILSVVAQ